MISSCLRITQNKFSFDVFECVIDLSDDDSDETLGYILTKTSITQVFGWKISVKFDCGKTHLNRFKVTAILNIQRMILILNGLWFF